MGALAHHIEQQQQLLLEEVKPITSHLIHDDEDDDDFGENAKLEKLLQISDLQAIQCVRCGAVRCGAVRRWCVRSMRACVRCMHARLRAYTLACIGADGISWRRTSGAANSADPSDPLITEPHGGWHQGLCSSYSRP